MFFVNWLRGNDANRARNCFLWNSICGAINALQSTFILFILQRLANTEVSGVFIIAFATANLLQNIGRYGVRYYQASDTTGKYAFGEYVSHRIATSGLMMLVAVAYCAFKLLTGAYAPDKALVCLLLCAQKLMDCIEDAYYGEYQRVGKLDVAGRAMTVRLLVVIAAFIAGYVGMRSLAWATVVSIVAGTAVLALMLSALTPDFGKPRIRLASPAIMGLMRECFPLFAGAFLLMFIVNVPKFAIDAELTSSDQAVYGFISMPVFIVALLAEFVFRPMTNDFTEDWLAGRIGPFKKRIVRMLAVILGITAVCIVGGIIVGIPVMSLLFKYPLKTQWLPLGILLLGSGVLSMTSFQAMILTIIRKQKYVILSYIPSVLLSIPVCILMVRRGGLLGAALSYLVLVAVMLVCISAFVIRNIRARETE